MTKRKNGASAPIQRPLPSISFLILASQYNLNSLKEPWGKNKP